MGLASVRRGVSTILHKAECQPPRTCQIDGGRSGFRIRCSAAGINVESAQFLHYFEIMELYKGGQEVSLPPPLGNFRASCPLWAFQTLGRNTRGFFWPGPYKDKEEQFDSATPCRGVQWASLCTARETRVSKDPSKIKHCLECKRMVDALTMRPLARQASGGGVRRVCAECYCRVTALRKTVRDSSLIRPSCEAVAQSAKFT